MKKILLTGSTGFIGSHILKLLKKNNHQVIPFAGDITKAGDWEKNLQKSPEALIHTAGVRTESDTDFQVNVGGVEALSKALTKTPQIPKSLIFLSSQAVYIGSKPPFKEDMTLHPATTYGQSKLQAEEVIEKISQALNIRTAILRLSPVFGKGVREKSNMSGPLFIWTQNALKNEPLKVFLEGTQTRDYISVSDVSQAVLLALENSQIKGIFNIGGGEKIKLLKLARMVKKAAESKSEIKILSGEASIHNPLDLFSDTQKIKQFGWEPKEKILDTINSLFN